MRVPNWLFVLAVTTGCSGISKLDSAELVTQCENVALRQLKSPGDRALFNRGPLR